MSKILIVEDEVALLGALKDKFEREGYEVVTAINGQDGLQKALISRPDLILLDIIMPVKDGITMIKEMKEIKEIKDTPVILLTNLADSDKVLEAVRNGVHDYLVKSDWKIEDVVKDVADRIKNK